MSISHRAEQIEERMRREKALEKNIGGHVILKYLYNPICGKWGGSIRILEIQIHLSIPPKDEINPFCIMVFFQIFCLFHSQITLLANWKSKKTNFYSENPKKYEFNSTNFFLSRALLFLFKS